MISTIFMPLTKIYDVNELIKKGADEGYYSISLAISDHLIDESEFYFKYLLTASFVSQGVVMLDLPHWFS